MKYNFLLFSFIFLAAVNLNACISADKTQQNISVKEDKQNSSNQTTVTHNPLTNTENNKNLLLAADTVKPEEKKKYYNENEEIPEEQKFYKEKYEETYNQPFEIVWKAIKKSLEDIGCMVAQENAKQDTTGTYRGYLKSEMCVIVSGKEITLDTIQKYSLHVPVILGGVWLNGRIQFKYTVKEEKDGKVSLVMRTEMSGFENFVTHEVHFWKSNGMLEMEMLDRIKKNIDKELNGKKN